MSENEKDLSKCNEVLITKEEEGKIDKIEKTDEDKMISSVENNNVMIKENALQEKDVLMDKINESTDVVEEKDNKTEQEENVKGKEKEESVQNKLKSNDDINEDNYEEHITYEKNGNIVYTDPKTQFQYIWCAKTHKWLAKELIENPYENEHYRWCNETQKWIPKLQQQATINDQQQQEEKYEQQQEKQKQQQHVTETEYYKWDAEKNDWVPKHNFGSIEGTNYKYDVDEQGQRICTDADGTQFFWDAEKSAWFPKLDETFMAMYQMNYGFNTADSNKTSDANSNIETSSKGRDKPKESEQQQKEDEQQPNDTSGTLMEKVVQSNGIKRKLPETPKWFDLDPAHNTKVYVWNLPLDITIEEFGELMGKCGLIMRDPTTMKYKIKLYTEPDGQIKGDGLCDYIKVESVDLALNILDEYVLRGHKIRVQRAKFQMKGEYNPALKPKRKKKDKEKLAKIKEKLFDWRPEKMRGERFKHEKVVIIKNLFSPDIFEKEVQLILEYQTDLRDECSKCGQVRKVIIYDRHSDGVAQVNMSTAEEADLVVQMMHGRYFGKRQLTAEHWDGKTKYKIEETESEAKMRLNNWDEYLLSSEENKETIKREKDDIVEVKAETETKSTEYIENSNANETIKVCTTDKAATTQPNATIESS